jgi:hypothetical protein
MADGSNLGDGFREYVVSLKQRAEALLAHARGDISDEQLAERLGPPDPLGKAIREAPEGSFGAMIRKSGKEILAAAARRVSAGKK